MKVEEVVKELRKRSSIALCGSECVDPDLAHAADWLEALAEAWTLGRCGVPRPDDIDRLDAVTARMAELETRRLEHEMVITRVYATTAPAGSGTSPQAPSPPEETPR